MAESISRDMPPRHRDTGALCMQATLHGGCPENHDYHAGPLTPEEIRWWYVELMLEQIADLAPGTGKPHSSADFNVDDVTRNENGAIVTIYGTVFCFDEHGATTMQEPYILGDF